MKSSFRVAHHSYTVSDGKNQPHGMMIGGIKDQILEFGNIFTDFRHSHFTGRIQPFLVMAFYFDLHCDTVFCGNK